MSVSAIGIAGIAGLLALILARVPIALALALSGFFGYVAIDGWPKALKMLGTVPFSLASAYSLSVIPLFLLMGTVAVRANMSRELFDAANAVFSGFRGALANATIGGCAAFGAICGSSIATAATFARVSVPEMRRHGYDPGFAAGAVAAAGTLGILIPPSVLLAIYAIVAEESLPKLFAAALLPGVVLAVLYVLTIMAMARLRPGLMPRTPSMPFADRLRAARGTWKMLLLFFLSVGGIYLGWFSPTEAAAVSAAAAIVIGFATGKLGMQGLIDATLEAVSTTAVIFFIAVGAFIFARFITLTQFPTSIAGWIRGVEVSPIWILAAVAVLYIVLGTFLDEISTILITVPVTLPLVGAVGYDPVWFGVFVMVMCTIGLVSPPTGMTVFVIQAQHPDISAARIYLGTLPFLVADFVLVGLLVAFPALATWLPTVMKV